MRKPFTYALAAALYIVSIVLVVNFTGSMEPKETIIIPMVMLCLLVTSVAVMAFLFFSEPLRLFLEHKSDEAIAFFGKMVGFFVCFALIFVVLVFVI